MTSDLWAQFVSVCSTKGNAPAILHGTTTVSFADLERSALGIAARLKTISPGDRVILSGENSPAFLAVVAGIWHRGAIPVLVHVDAPPSHLEHAITVAQPAAAFAECETPLSKLMPCIPVEAPKDQSETPPTATGTKTTDPGSIVFTSGSSGLPKGVTQSAQNLISGSARVANALGYRDDDRILCPIPFAFDYGWGQCLSVLLQGATLVLPTPRTAFGICDALTQHRPTIFAAVPAVMAELTSGLAPITDAPRGSVRLITNTGSKIAAPIFKRIGELFPNASISLNYGLTETYRSASLPVDQAQDYPSSVGVAFPDVQLDVFRTDGTIADPLEEGEIVHSGAGVFDGYWADPERTAAVRRPHPLSGEPAVFTGDLGHKDAQGRLYIHGRRDRQMKSMGVRVAPDELEALLMESGLLESAAISSLPHDMIGDMIVACVVPKDRQAPEKDTIKALRVFARKTMSAHMQPRKYLVLATLPETRSAKTDYFSLSQMVRASS